MQAMAVIQILKDCEIAFGKDGQDVIYSALRKIGHDVGSQILEGCTPPAELTQAEYISYYATVINLIPNALGPIIVYTTLTIPQVMLLEAFLSFLGLGVQAPMSSWGLLIGDGADHMEQFPWLLLFPSITLSLTLFSLNFLGDGLRDALDPRASRD
mgnify:CR=1 FL=1